jgi:uncharacterized protein YuzE
MKLSYDPKYNIAYLRLQEKSGEVNTIHIGDALNIDIAPDGSIYGIEFLNANEQLAKADSIEIANELTGQCAQIKLTG